MLIKEIEPINQATVNLLQQEDSKDIIDEKI